MLQRESRRRHNFQSCFPPSADCSPPARVLCTAGNVGPRRLLWYLPLNRPSEALKSALHMIQQWHFSLKDHQQLHWRCNCSGPSRVPADDFSDKHTFHLCWCETSVIRCHRLLSGKKWRVPSAPVRWWLLVVLSSNQQWGLNRFVNFPGDSRCLDDLAVESGGIRFAGRQSVHSFQQLLSRGITSGACCSDNADLIANKQICPIFNKEGTPSNLPHKHRFRTCSAKVTIVLGIMRQATNDPVPVDLKTLLEHLFV